MPCAIWRTNWACSYLRHDGPEHVLAFAPTRLGLVVLTLLSWPGSAVIHDWTAPRQVDIPGLSFEHRRQSMSAQRFTPEFKEEAVKQVD